MNREDTTAAEATTKKLDLRSFDITAEKRAELLRLFPEARTEGGKIDFDRLKLALGETVDVGRERYGMTWPGKADCFRTIQTPSLATLLPDRGESVNFDTTENMIIEGDNLEVLKLLQKSYLGKVKMIYIDPPYNTGNDFIYPDNYTESLQTYLEFTGQVDAEGRKFSTNTESDGRFHSKWMNMMYPRLCLARNLLEDGGFLLVSIDDAELSNARILLNLTFGEENLIGIIVFDRNRKNDAKFLSVGHEYMIVCARDKAFLKSRGTRLRATKEGVETIRNEFARLKSLHGPDWKKIASGLKEFFAAFAEDDPRQPLTRFTRVDERGPYRTDGDPSWPGGGGPEFDVLHPITGKPCKVPGRGWVWATRERMQEEIDKGNIVFGKDETTIPAVRRDLFDKDDQVLRSVIFSYAQKAAQDFATLFEGKNVFDNPKSYRDLARLVEYFTDSDSLVLDFFAGSGTTGHGTLLANQRDAGSRRFILVQLPEPTDRDDYKTIADITKERVRRVIKKLDDEDAGKLDLNGGQKQDRGFRVFKLAESNFRTWDADASKQPEAMAEQLELHVDHVRAGRSDEDRLFEILMKSGYALTTRIETLELEGKKVFSAADGALLVCLEAELTLEAIRAVAALMPERVVCLDAAFAGNDQLKANAVQIFKSLHRRSGDGESASDVTVFRTV